MLDRSHASELGHAAGVVYINPYASRDTIRRIRRFLKGHAAGRYRWGHLYQYPMIEFENIDDLTAMRTRFARLVEAYMDMSDSLAAGEDQASPQP